MEEINLSIASAQAVNRFLEVVNTSLLSPICSARPDLVSTKKDVTLSLVEQNWKKRGRSAEMGRPAGKSTNFLQHLKSQQKQQ